MVKKKSPQSIPANLDARARELIEEQSTMTLATASEGEAWAAAVYYVYIGPGFYFFSDPGSRHIRESEGGSRVSGEIHANASSWRDIRGLQMSGFVESIPPGKEALLSIGAYLKKFPFARELFPKGVPPDMETFAEHFRVRLYRFKPLDVYYLDNSIRFGFREGVNL